MEGQDRNSAARCHDIRQLFQKCLQHFKFLIDVDTQSLKHALAGLFHGILFLLVIRQEAQCPFNDFPQLRRRLDRMLFAELGEDLRCDLLCIRLIGIFLQHPNQFFLCYFLQTFCGGHSLLRVQTQIQRTI